MGTVLRSIDDLISRATAEGMLARQLSMRVGVTTTAATATCGFVTAQRYPQVFIMPTLGGSVTAAYFTALRMTASQGVVTVVAAHETLLGTLTISGNVFAAGSTMPTKTILGTSLQTATMIPMLVVTTALTATAPVITITYTDQAGNTGNSCALTLPNNATINTAFFMLPHMASGDSAIQAVTNISTSAGSAGVLRVYGLLPVSVSGQGVATNSAIEPLLAPYPMIPFASADTLAFYQFGSTTAGDIHAMIGAVGDN